MRTLAVVDFFQPVDLSLTDVHSEIMSGKSIGIALREQEWKIEKRAVYFGEASLSSHLMGWMDEHCADKGAVYIYRLEVSKSNENPLPYCTIIELYSPQYLSKEWLQSLYGDQYKNHSLVKKRKCPLTLSIICLSSAISQKSI